MCQSLLFKNSALLLKEAEKILKAEQTKAERMVQAILLPLAGRDLEAKLDLAKAICDRKRLCESWCICDKSYKYIVYTHIYIY